MSTALITLLLVTTATALPSPALGEELQTADPVVYRFQQCNAGDNQSRSLEVFASGKATACWKQAEETRCRRGQLTTEEVQALTDTFKRMLKDGVVTGCSPARRDTFLFASRDSNQAWAEWPSCQPIGISLELAQRSTGIMEQLLREDTAQLLGEDTAQLLREDAAISIQMSLRSDSLERQGTLRLGMTVYEDGQVHRWRVDRDAVRHPVAQQQLSEQEYKLLRTLMEQAEDRARQETEERQETSESMGGAGGTSLGIRLFDDGMMGSPFAGTSRDSGLIFQIFLRDFSSY